MSAPTRRRPPARRAGVVAVTAFALLAAGAALPSPATADTAPPDPGTPATVTADPLPTWQIDGVVWDSVTVGNTVYVTGKFTTARPSGVALGGTGQVPAGNIFAFDIRTGARVATFDHSLNAQGLAIAASPDGSRVYVGGDFTTVDGVARTRLAAFDTATGALVTTFAPRVAAQVRALAVTGGTSPTVYVGGGFTSVNGTIRNRLAALTTSGTLRAWAPAADAAVWALTTTPDRSKVVVGGHFTTLAGTPRYGLGAVDATTGASLPWAAESVIRDGGVDASITSLSTDGTLVYGTGYSFGTGNFEGVFALVPDGTIAWLNDCQGDNYDVAVLGKVAYAAGHTHNCAMIGDFPEQTPRFWQRATAWTAYATGTNNGPDMYGWNYRGRPAGSLLHWYPKLAPGTFTGQSQAAYTVTGNSTYVVYAGEFPTVNGKAQQGLVRFAVPSVAPRKNKPSASTSLTPSVSTGFGSAAVRWGATSDYDNRRLTYTVLRDEVAVATLVQDSTWWNRPAMRWNDTSVASGTHTYRVTATDPDGNTVSGASVQAFVF